MQNEHKKGMAEKKTFGIARPAGLEPPALTPRKKRRNNRLFAGKNGNYPAKNKPTTARSQTANASKC